MKRILSILFVLSIFSFHLTLIAQRLNIDVSKNSLDISVDDSIAVSYFLVNPAITSIKYVNIFGGNEVMIEESVSRDRGPHKFYVSSEFLKTKKANIPSGVYYLQMEAIQSTGTKIEFNSFAEPWGKIVEGENPGLNLLTGEVTYTLPEACLTKVRIGFDNGSLVKTLINLAPEIEGAKNLWWDGYDQTGTLKISNALKPIVKIIAFSIPKTSFILKNDLAPVVYVADPVYPDNWQRFALNPFAKTAWNKSVDVPLNFKVSKTASNDISFNFEEQTLAFNSLFSSLNEIYISIDNEHIVENPNVMIPGQYTVAFPELGTGIHTVLVNIILPDNVVAAGTYQLKINN